MVFVLKSKEVRQKMVAVKRLNENLLFWRNETGKTIFFVDYCPHRAVWCWAWERVFDSYHVQYFFHLEAYGTRIKTLSYS